MITEDDMYELIEEIEDHYKWELFISVDKDCEGLFHVEVWEEDEDEWNGKFIIYTMYKRSAKFVYSMLKDLYL